MIQASAKSIETNKTVYINELFAKIAKKYDLLNNLMTFGLHNKWKEKTIKLALKEINTPAFALDLCTGTGDLAIILNKFSPETKIICSDNCNEMLEITKQKIKNLNLTNLSLESLDSENLPYPASVFDLITIGFGLRNLVNKEKCIYNIYKILKSPGVFACLDIAHPINHLWKKVYYFYFFNIIPLLGKYFAKNKEAYTYLPTSLLSWYKQEELQHLFINSGFKKAYFKNILGGAIAIHIAIK